MLQTSEYAREYLHLSCGPLSFGADEDAVDQMVAKRIQRQQVLYQHGKQVTVVMLEGALRARVVSAPTLAGQLDRLMAVSQGPAPVTGVFPAGDFLPLLETGIQAIQLSPYHADLPGAPPRTPGRDRRFPGMLFVPFTFRLLGQPLDPEISPLISARCAGDITLHLVAQQQQSAGTRPTYI